MTESGQIYKCVKCGNIVEVLHIGAGELVCCGEPMGLMIEKNEDEGRKNIFRLSKNRKWRESQNRFRSAPDGRSAPYRMD